MTYTSNTLLIHDHIYRVDAPTHILTKLRIIQHDATTHQLDNPWEKSGWQTATSASHPPPCGGLSFIINQLVDAILDLWMILYIYGWQIGMSYNNPFSLGWATGYEIIDTLISHYITRSYTQTNKNLCTKLLLVDMYNKNEAKKCALEGRWRAMKGVCRK